MPSFIIINNNIKITLSERWTLPTKFNSKSRLVDAKGNRVSADYKGRRYRIIEKREWIYSTLERIGRVFVGVFVVIGSFSLALLSKSVRNLFTKSKENMRFGIPEEQTYFKVEQGKIVYIEPKLLFGGTKIAKDQELNFALINTDGKQKLVAVTSARLGKEYRTYEGSALEALLTLAQEKECSYISWYAGRHYGSPIVHFLKHPHNLIITKEEFFKFILEKDQTGTPRICTLNSDSTLEVLNLLKENMIPIDLNEKTPAGETLFTLWAGKGNAKITGTILELDPSVIQQIQGKIKSTFVEAVLNGSKEEADILIHAMEKEKMALSLEEVWIKRAFKNECEFSKDEFNQLDPDLKVKVFFVANAFANEAIVKKLKSLGMEEEPLFWPGPDIFAANMDIITARNVMENFLKGLKKEGLLLTEEEFSQSDKSKYVDKTDQIGRILGRNFIERLAKENGLKHIKVPKKIVVIKKGVDAVSFYIAKSFEPMPKADQLKIYAERIEPLDRKLSLEEAIELMIILEKTGYNDFCGNNFFFAKDGIYFIDTEFNAFSPTNPKFDAIKTVKDCLLDSKDREKFLAEYEKRKDAYEKSKEIRKEQEAEFEEAFKDSYRNLIKGYRKQEFTFHLKEL